MGLVFLFTFCSKKEELFVQHSAKKTGISFSNNLEPNTEINILNYLYAYNGAGITSGDFNNDGLQDLFFSGNLVPDELYLNKGNLRFEKVTKKTGIEPIDSWSTGVSQVDINNDGLLDIYICKASKYRNLKGKNLLYVNQGVNNSGIPFFKEEAAKYGLDFSGLSTHASFFDYDLDGDLDMYLLNHSVHPNRNYGIGKLRKGYDPIAGDILFQNQDGYFSDVSEETGIFQGRIGYGLGLSIGDINNDGYPDIYIGNDFFENDYLYINQGDGTFSEAISNNENLLGHTSHFSMGNAIADMNNDGLMDIISLDMLPEDLKTYKSSGLEYSYPIYRQYLNKGYAPQFMQNTFHLNLDGERFSEIGNLSGISATEWSWGASAADFDNDGYKDLYITNGILGATNDMDYMNFIANEDIQKRIGSGLEDNDLPMVSEIPPKKVSNYIFKNNGDLTFSNKSPSWIKTKPSFSNGSIYVDLDNDGDLEIVVNNLNEPVFILENKSIGSNHLRLKFEGPEQNRFGIGTKAILYNKTKKQVAENFTSKGYMSTVSPILHFGLGKENKIDSLKIRWPNGRFQLLKNINANQTILIKYSDASATDPIIKTNHQLFKINDTILAFKHHENVSLDFDREPLIPFVNSNQGPSVAIADINKDGFEDIFIGGAKTQAGKLFLQSENGNFLESQPELFHEFELNEDTASIFFDANGDGWQDLIIGSGGNEFTSGKAIQPRLYVNKNGTLHHSKTFANMIEANISSIIPTDFDSDGDFDVLLNSDQVPNAYGKTPKQYLLQNDGNGNFIDVSELFAPGVSKIGNVKESVFKDVNGDGLVDLVMVGHWMPISIFLNDGTKFIPQQQEGLEYTHGLWNTVKIEDLDRDGDLDLVCGNWGLNSKFKASKEKPITLYRNDFDENGSIEPLITYFHKDTETPFASKDELVKQLPYLNKEFLSYSKFASATITEVFGADKLKSSKKKHVFELNSCYFENTGNGTFKKHSLPLLAQSSQINDIMVEDINEDGYPDLILMGNNYHVSTQLGRLDALHGLVLINDQKGNFSKSHNLKIDGQVSTIKKLKFNGKKGFLIGRNNDRPLFLSEKE